MNFFFLFMELLYLLMVTWEHFWRKMKKKTITKVVIIKKTEKMELFLWRHYMGKISEMNCRDFKVLSWLFYFVVVSLGGYIWPQVVKSYGRVGERCCKKSSQVNILKIRMMRNVEYSLEKFPWHAAWVAYQDVYLFPKVNRMLLPYWKCCVSCVGGMLDRSCVHIQRVGGRCDHEDCVGV